MVRCCCSSSTEHVDGDSDAYELTTLGKPQRAERATCHLPLGVESGGKSQHEPEFCGESAQCGGTCNFQSRSLSVCVCLHFGKAQQQHEGGRGSSSEEGGGRRGTSSGIGINFVLPTFVKYDWQSMASRAAPQHTRVNINSTLA